nr:hypothetical protein [Tanacetum cinerariifolium]
PLDVEWIEAEQLKIVLRRRRHETHISQQGGSSTDEGTISKPGVPDVPSDDSEEEISWNSSDDEDEEESFDPIPRTPEDGEDDGNGDEDQGLRISEEERMHEEEEADELYRDVDIKQGRGLQVSQDIDDSHVTLTPLHSDGQQESSLTSSFVTSLLNPIIDPVFCFEDRVKSLEVNFSEFIRTNQSQESVSNIPENDEFLRTIDDNMKKIIKEQVKSQVKAQVTRILPRIKESVNAQLEAKVLADHLTPQELHMLWQLIYEQRNLYKALVEAYDADKTILDSYGESAILKRRREDDDDQEGTSAGSDRGSKRRRESGEHALASTPSEPATRSAGRSTTGTQSRQLSASVEDQPIVQTSQHPEWFSQPRKPPTLHHTLIDFSNLIMNRLGVDTLTPELLAGPTYELMRGSCNRLTELEYHLEEVYKAMTDQLDWVHPEGQQYPHNLLQPLPLILDNR